MAEAQAALSAASARLRRGKVEAAAEELTLVLASGSLAPSDPVRQLISAARGLLVLLPDPHTALALDCVDRARKLPAAEEPGQTTLWS